MVVTLGNPIGGQAMASSKKATDGYPPPVLKAGAVYFSDNGRVICAKCAGQSALYTGRDISGQKVARVTLQDVREWEQGGDLGQLACEMGCTTLSPIAGPDGWPMVKGGAQ